MTPIVYIVDDDPGFRDSLRSLLESDGIAAQTYPDAGEFLERYVPGEPGCLLLDVRMPGMSGLQLQEELQRRHIAIPVVFITAHGDVAMAVAAVRRGALDFIEKPFDDEALIGVIREALQKDKETRKETERRTTLDERFSSLSTRELEVLDRVVKGKRNRIIAEELGITEKTVEFHRKRIMGKLQAKNVVELVNLVVQHRLAGRSG
jgi:two-component system response regulator TtrR